MKSMTSFSRVDQNFEGYQVNLEIKTVNHRYLDIHIKMPESIRFLEIAIRELIAEFIKRGRVDVFLKIEFVSTDAQVLNVNQPVVESILNAANKIIQLDASLQRLSVDDILKWPGVLDIANYDEEDLEKNIINIFKQALTELVKTRKNEGDKTKAFLFEKLNQIQSHHGKVIEQLAIQAQELQDKIKEKLDALSIQVDQDRFEQEVLYHLNKMDINEEVERLSTHIKACEVLFDNEQPVGRKLDFMMQELQREVNTLGTKSSMIDIKNASLEMKVAIEQIREQVQNIE